MKADRLAKPPRTWLITGATGGFGRALAKAVLASGDNAVLGARQPAQLDDLVGEYPDTAIAVELDVTRPDHVSSAVAQTRARFGGLSILVNNAGYSLVGAIEEVEPDEYMPLFKTNLFGVIELTRAALPLLRDATDARIVNVSSVGGFVSTAGFGHYNATKFALEGMSEALALELAPSGIAVIIVQPGAFRTNVLGAMVEARKVLPQYEQTVGPSRRYSREADGNQLGDPALGAALIISAVNLSDPPLRLPLGADACKRISAKLAAVQEGIDAWKDRSAQTAHSDGALPPDWDKR